MEGKVVRLVRGDPKQLKSYQNFGDPETVALRWESQGAKIIHIIDLDAALGSGHNLQVIEKAAKAVNVPIQYGGGIRWIEKARRLLDRGFHRIILGSLAFQKPKTVEQLIQEFGKNRVVVALDNLDEAVMIEGWKASSQITLDEALHKFRGLGADLFLVTSVSRDGTMSGPDIKGLKKVVASGTKIIAAGGIKDLDDVASLKSINVYGAVIGKALYEGSISLKEAINMAEKGEKPSGFS